MKFSQKFLVTNFLILGLVIIANIFALKHFSSAYFGDYVDSIKKQTVSNDFSLEAISKLLDSKILDKDTIEEYKKITNDLSNISSSLERFSKDPKTNNISLIESLKEIGLPQNAIEKIIGTNALESFFGNISNFFRIDYTTPEGIFVLKTLKSMLYFNLVLIAILSIILYLWIRYTFRPIKEIISNLSNIINKKEYKNISYNKKDEFFPLVETINNLNKNLGLQEKIRSDFLSDLSHEIKTPITAVKCYLEGIEDGIISLDEKNIKLLHSEIDRLIKITSFIMDYEKEESKKFGDIFIDKIDLVSLLDFMRTEYSKRLTINNQEIYFDNSRKFYINVDKDKFIQILHNIFSNFMKYAGNNTKMDINFSHKKGSSVIIFKDNGSGVKPEDLPFLKEKFYKGEKTRNKSKDLGVGIGLSIIEKIVSIHGGSFEIDSEQGKGFEIKIILPN